MANWEKIRHLYESKPIRLGLERLRVVRASMGNRQPPIVIAVGGTNGKGSCCAMLDRIYRCAGYRVGLYTSPHLLSFHERIVVNGEHASDEMLDEAFSSISAIPAAELLTQFELDTLVAIYILNNQQVDVAILEVGLGGRLDAVNVFDNDCAIVTSVDIDHTDYLGDTREKIAFEKAGIFRAGRVAICAEPAIPHTLSDYAQQIGASLWRIGHEFGYQQVLEPGKQWSCFSPLAQRHALPYPALRGAFQLNNASAVLAAVDVLKDRLPVSMEAVRRGLTEVTLPGRFQFVPGRPTLILDVAHNPHAALSLAQNLANLPPCPRTFAVFSMLKDKDIAAVVSIMNPQVDVWLIAGLDMSRGASVDELQQLMGCVDGQVLRFASVAQALSYACQEAAENDRIVAFGSFHTVAAVMSARDMQG